MLARSEALSESVEALEFATCRCDEGDV
jgi:hypothetical protein